MTRLVNLRHEFVEFIPKELVGGTVYVSIPYATVAHRCFCGCDNEVVTPLSPTDWKVIFNGETISLSPSIGNWGALCQSHYWIIEDRVKWDVRWSAEQVAATQASDRIAKQRQYSRDTMSDAIVREEDDTPRQAGTADEVAISIWQRIWRWLG